MKIKKTVPILSVEKIEISLPFWTETLGYTKIMDVPHNGVIGFAILQKDGSEIMLQTHASVAADLPQIAHFFRPGSLCLYSDVDSIDEVAAAVKDATIIVPLRTTFYGAKEIWIRDSDGNILGFAEQSQ